MSREQLYELILEGDEYIDPRWILDVLEEGDK